MTLVKHEEQYQGIVVQVGNCPGMCLPKTKLLASVYKAIMEVGPANPMRLN